MASNAIEKMDRLGLDVISESLEDRGLESKMTIAFVIVALLVGVAGLAGFVGLGTVDDQAQLIAEDGVKMDSAAEMIIAIEQQQSAIQAAELGESGAQAEFERASDDFETQAANLEATHLSEEQAEMLSTVRAAHEDYNRLGAEYFEAKEAGNEGVAADKVAAMEMILPAMEESAHALEESASADLEVQVAAADSTTLWTRVTLVGITIGAFVAAIAVGLFMARRITSSVTKVADAAVAMSEGELDDDLDDHTANDEIGQMVDAFNAMQSNLRGVFRDLDGMSQNLKDGELSQEIETDYPGAYGAVMANLDEGTDALTTSFDQIRRASAALSEGRLDEDIDTASPGEYGEVLCALEDGIERLSDSLNAVQEIATEVATSSEEVASSTEEIEQASDQVAASVQEISHGTEDQSENLQKVATEMNNLSSTVEEIAASSEEVANTAVTAVDHGKTGQDHAAKATEEIQSIETQVEEASTQVQSIDDEMEQIGEIVEMITDIAEQTNLLALNASIEAARAGEAGKGFAVVADEIKSLAEETRLATDDVATRITGFQSTTDKTVEGMQEMQARVEVGAETIEETIGMFSDIADAIEETERGIKEISSATEDQAASSEEVVSMVDDVFALGEETAAEASEVSAATEEQASSVSEASQNVQRLSALADELHGQVSEFELREATMGGVTGGLGAGADPSSATTDGGYEPSDGSDHRPV